MEGFSIWHWLVVVMVVAIFVALPAWMTVRILSKAGRSSLWCLLLFVPVVNIVMVWVFAFALWPALEASAATPSRPESKDPTTPGI
ncbi:MAG: hypothetical protein ACE5KL_02830 [Alphaproteobacteria bacterium]